MRFPTKYNPTLTCIVFFLCPILALPYILDGIFKKKKLAYLLGAIFMGLIAYLTIPYADLFRHTMHYFEAMERSWNVFKSGLDFDSFSDYVNYFFSHHGIPYQYFRFLELTECSYFMIWIFSEKISDSTKYYTRSDKVYRFWIMFFLFETIYTISGVRYGFALCQFVFGTYFIFDKKQYWGVAFYILAIWCHMSFAFFIPILLLLCLTSRNKYLAIILPVLVFYIGQRFIGELSLLMGRRADWYFQSGASLEGTGYKDVTFNGMVFIIAPIMLYIPMGWYIFRHYNKNSIWCRLFLAWLILWLALISNSVMFTRTRWGMQMMLMFAFIHAEEYYYVKKRILRIILLGALGITLLNIVNFRGFMTHSRYSYLATPVPIILEQEYEFNWIIMNIDNNEFINKEKEKSIFKE